MTCKGCMKVLLALINVLTIILSVGLAAFGILCIIESVSFIPQLNVFSSELKPIGYILVVLGVMLLVLSICGCCNSIYRSRCLMYSYMGFVSFILIILIGLLTYGLIKKEDVREMGLNKIGESFDKSRKKTGDGTDDAIVATLQYNLECCGWDRGPFYWTGGKASGFVPGSCCGVSNPSSRNCPINDANINTLPCKPKMFKWWEKYALWGLVVILGFFISLTIFCLIAACVIRSRSPNEDGYVYTRYSDHDTDKTGGTSGYNTTWL